MKILIAGASGFIGQALVKALAANHQLTVLGRNIVSLKQLFPAPIEHLDWQMLDRVNADTFDVVINLCGYNIAAARWNKKIKQEIINSRVSTTTQLSNWILKNNARVHFYGASAIGIYGVQKNNDLASFDETSPINDKQPTDFLAEVGIKWEAALQPLINAEIPVTITRFGVVLQKDKGILNKLAPVFNLGLGSVIGSGTQVLSWVHIADVVSAFNYLINNPHLTGSYNITSPNPIKQAEFAKALAAALHRPLWLKTPALIIKLLFGEMGETLLLKGQRVMPKRLLDESFQFEFPTIQSALMQEFG